MTFDVFLQALIKIGQAMYPQVPPSESLQRLVRSRMIPLHEAIMNEQKYIMGPDGTGYDLQFDELVALVLKDIGLTLHEIYTVYFPHEVRAVLGNNSGMPEDKVQRENESRIFQFMKEYEICPTLLNKGIVFQIYMHTKNENAQEYADTALSILQYKLKGQQAANKRNPYQSVDDLNQVQFVGKYFTFYKFLDLIVRVAKATFGGQSHRKESQV